MKIKKSKIVRYSVGIDEVGRGALAGPVMVAVALVPKELRIRNYKLGILRDSKKLTPNQREKWFKVFKNDSRIKYAIAKVHPRKIEKINISKAANLAALRAYLRLVKSSKFHVSNSVAYLDGGLYLGNDKNRLSAKTVIRGDQKIPAIKIASIIAKVSRDKLMTRLAKTHPNFGFEIHKGYGTKMHYAALKKHGPSVIHRQSFIKQI